MRPLLRSIHPYNNYEVITGQATCAKELYEEINDLDYILAPVGGGLLREHYWQLNIFLHPRWSMPANLKVLRMPPQYSFRNDRISTLC